LGSGLAAAAGAGGLLPTVALVFTWLALLPVPTLSWFQERIFCHRVTEKTVNSLKLFVNKVKKTTFSTFTKLLSHCKKKTVNS
jgi:hypothetical protein